MNFSPVCLAQLDDVVERRKRGRGPVRRSRLGRTGSADRAGRIWLSGRPRRPNPSAAIATRAFIRAQPQLTVSARRRIEHLQMPGAVGEDAQFAVAEVELPGRRSAHRGRAARPTAALRSIEVCCADSRVLFMRCSVLAGHSGDLDQPCVAHPGPRRGKWPSSGGPAVIRDRIRARWVPRPSRIRARWVPQPSRIRARWVPRPSRIRARWVPRPSRIRARWVPRPSRIRARWVRSPSQDPARRGVEPTHAHVGGRDAGPDRHRPAGASRAAPHPGLARCASR